MFFFWVNLILLIGLIILIIYESRQIIKHKEMIELFIESNSEIFGVVNVNAEVSRQTIARLEIVEKGVDFLKMIADAHAHALRIYHPELKEESLAEKIQSAE